MKKIIAIYNANGGFKGEMAYVFGKLSGNTHCALCDISHGYKIMGKPEWKKMIQEFDIPIEAIHRNDMDVATKIFVGENTPIVLLNEDGKLSVLMNEQELEDCNKDVGYFFKILKSKLA